MTAGPSNKMEHLHTLLTSPSSGFGNKKIDFISKLEWPQSCPDLNPMDYCVSSVLEEKACSSSHVNIRSLQASLQHEWQKIPQDILRRSVHQFPSRLKSVIRKKGGYIE